MTVNPKELRKLSRRRSRRPGIILAAVAIAAVAFGGMLWLRSLPRPLHRPETVPTDSLPPKMAYREKDGGTATSTSPGAPVPGKTPPIAPSPAASATGRPEAPAMSEPLVVPPPVTEPPAPTLERAAGSDRPAAPPTEGTSPIEGKPPPEVTAYPRPGGATVRLRAHAAWRKGLGACAKDVRVCLAPPRFGTDGDSTWLVYGDVFGEAEGPVVAVLNGQRVPLANRNTVFVGISPPIPSSTRLSVTIEMNSHAVATVVGDRSSVK
jgi:hypothetical protein